MNGRFYEVTREVTLTNWSRETRFVYAESEAEALRIAEQMPCCWDDCDTLFERYAWDTEEQTVTVSKKAIKAEPEEMPEVEI